MKITVVNLNPSIDWQMATQSFVYGGLNRVVPEGKYPAGKGISVCGALVNLGYPVFCTGFNYRENGSFITDALDKWQVSYDFITVEGAVRTNIKLYDTTKGTMTELNQPGRFVPESAITLLFEKLSILDQELLILSGSMPVGVPSDTYKKICDLWQGQIILDAEGEALRLALEGDKPPYCIKPNLYELEHSFGVKLPTREKIVAFCKDLIKNHQIEMICVSMGADGVMLVTATAAFFLPALDVHVKGVQGAGDALVAGIAYGITQGKPEPELLKIAAAAATASVIREGTLMCTREDYEFFLARMPIPILV